MLYKKSFLYIICSTCFLLVIWLLGYLGFSGIKTNASEFLNERIEKHHDIISRASSGGKKVLIVGDSNVLFDIDNKKMSDRLNISVYNMGSSVGLGMGYILYDAEKEIKDNDIVLLQLSYGLYDDSYDYDMQQLAVVWDDDKLYFEKIGFLDKIKLIYGLPHKLIFEKIKTILLGRKNIDQGIEDVKWIDEYGMIQSNTIDNSDKELLYTLMRQAEMKNILKGDTVLSKDKQKIIKDFLAYCKANNVKVYVSFPPYLYSKKYFNEEDIRSINKIKSFWEDNGVIVINNYTDGLYDVNDFCNSLYHLNNEGREKYTNMIIEKLKPYINKN